MILIAKGKEDVDIVRRGESVVTQGGVWDLWHREGNGSRKENG